MRMHVRIEGTPEEIDGVLRALPQVAVTRTSAVELTDAAASTATEPRSTENEERSVTTRFARRVLTRRRLQSRITAVLSALYEAHPQRLSLPDLQGVADYTPAQFAGLMGAFHRRIVNTDGYDPDTRFFDIRWNDGGEVWEYGLPDSVVEALKLEELF